MPTGYTDALYEGEDVSFEQFVWRCARGMGALVTMRDDPPDTPIPMRFVPQTAYYDRELEAARAEVARIESMPLDEIAARARDAFDAWKIERMERRRAEEIERTESRNRWLQELRASLEGVEA